MVPANRPTPPAYGRNVRSSSVLVAERTTTGSVPAVAVKMFCADVASDVPVATPISGVTSVGDVLITNVSPVPVCESIDVALPTLVIGPVRFAFVVTVPAVSPEAVPVALVATNVDGVPRSGVTSVGDVPNTSKPDPVSSEITPANSADVVAAKADRLLPVVVNIPLASGNV